MIVNMHLYEAGGCFDGVIEWHDKFSQIARFLTAHPES